jgi:predicted Zn-dependent peptidase
VSLQAQFETVAFLMAQEHSDVTLADVKRLLDQFAASRADRPRKDVESEYGDLLLYLILLAGKSRVDLLAGANMELDRRGRDQPRPAGLDL